MLREYLYNGARFQFAEGEQPEGAVELKGKPPEKAAATPANKAAKPVNKARKAGSK